MSDKRVLGWDVGGANTKAALAVGSRVRVVTRPYPIWENAQKLGRVLAEIADELGPTDLMGVTMTAELADAFRSKADGVGFVLDAMGSSFPDTPVSVFTVDGAFRSIAEARRTPLAVASANWAATGRLLGREVGDALLIDVGTTTTDIVPIVGGELAACGRTDPDRLANGELVYTGVVRTPVCAIAHSVPWRGRRCRVAAELFAQAGDVHLWLGNISELDYSGRTPDGRGKTKAEAGARLARMICGDSSLMSADEISRIARHLAERQAQAIAAAIFQVRARLGPKAPGSVIGAGLGSFLARSAAVRLRLGYRALGERLGEAVSRAAPAVAVARLLQEVAG